jgi:hypothetical protein
MVTTAITCSTTTLSNAPRRLRSHGKPNKKTKRLLLLQDRLSQKQAFEELLHLCRMNGGPKHGDVETISQDYIGRGFNKVTARNLYYRLEQLKDSGKTVLASEHQAPSTLIDVAEMATGVSPLTDEENSGVLVNTGSNTSTTTSTNIEDDDDHEEMTGNKNGNKKKIRK